MFAYIDPEYARIKKRFNLFLYGIVAIVFFVIFVVSLVQIKHHRALKAEIAHVSQLRDQMVEVIEKELMQVTEENARLEKCYSAYIKKLRNSSVFLASIFSALEEAVGDDVVISKLALEKNNLIFEGSSINIASIQYFYTTLSKQSWVLSVAISRIDRMQDKDKKYFFIVEVEVQHD